MPLPTIHSPITKLPPEIFAKICDNLSPENLLNLSKVCCKFDGYLCAPNSYSTQQIWKKSCLKFLPKKKIPPKGMDEKRYVELLVGRDCQICKIKKQCNIYWEFGVRCCLKCFNEKTLKIDIIESQMMRKYPKELRDILDIIPYYDGVDMKYYWMGQISFELYQYLSFLRNDLSNLQSWLNDKKHVFDSIMKYAEAEAAEENQYLYAWYFWKPWPSFKTPLRRRPFVLPYLITEYYSSIEGSNTINNSHFDDSDELKNNKFVKPKKKKTKYFRKHDNYQKGKNLKKKFAYKYG
ncbi:7138_t:CDS:2 [Funneliformis caledonium]|uniref:7138_t:CDS:1 n=1 Tax=Funneliformis caledonium TaxID=1117310 RepID=A0A9N9IJ92_9GLOM|nr:7138_t:CDS:2 [Funneliformis caledonium]